MAAEKPEAIDSKSHPTRVRGLKLFKHHANTVKNRVAPHAGAWIETAKRWRAKASRKESHPTRVRGLKQDLADAGLQLGGVAPHAGAWIETRQPLNPPLAFAVAPHAGAWIETCQHQSLPYSQRASHPTRVRGLKLRER